MQGVSVSALHRTEIDELVVEGVLAGRIHPGMRLGEQQLGGLFGVSRTRVREALIRLKARGIVRVEPRRGWFVVEPSLEEARQAFEARRAIEVGLLHCAHRLSPQAMDRIRDHVCQERGAISEGDVAHRSFLLGDFHVCLAELLGNRLIADILRDLTARTLLISMLYQSQHDAHESCSDHERILDALAAGDVADAARLMSEHIGTVEAGLRTPAAADPIAGLREALRPPVSSLVSTLSTPAQGDMP